MAFGALAAYAFNGPLKLGLVPSAILAMVATAILSLLLTWRCGARFDKGAPAS